MTNMAAGVLNKKITDEEVGETAASIEERFCEYVTRIIKEF